MENSKGWIDISVPLYTGMAHWPDNPPVRIERMMDLARGDAANVSKIELGAHTGTHMDAPRHFLADGAGIDEMPFDATIGPARVIRIEHPQAILPEELEAHNLQAGERVLFRTQNSERCWNTDEFVEDFVYISAAAAQYPGRSASAHDRGGLPLGRWVCVRWRRDASNPAERGHLADRRAEPVGGGTRHV